MYGTSCSSRMIQRLLLKCVTRLCAACACRITAAFWLVAHSWALPLCSRSHQACAHCRKMRKRCLQRCLNVETKREKILEARHREIRLKERSRSEQSKEEETKDREGEERAEDLVAYAEKEFYEMVEAEMKKRGKEEKIVKEKNKENSEEEL
ncbi:hypothetical protein PHYPO_G00037070 [Pangasianodon hypophthalmus]|uniref:Uncharacterized protein n=1 Tax=Pangasianodon hypophthalmus TaxID=310915 RepID=A0A5N5MMR7_PANHP|nr:hypothetical protein PHYPO_G00037070 [Pangasianodon hypophthalmus]